MMGGLWSVGSCGRAVSVAGCVICLLDCWVERRVCCINGFLGCHGQKWMEV